MRGIIKGSEPASLTQHRASSHCDYDNYPAMDELRQALVNEQRGLCCYCMARIRPDAGSMKIEHWRCQATYPAEQLSYRNLLGGCTGGEGQPARLQHCDTRKGDADLQWNPADRAHAIEARVTYELDGTIRSDDWAFENQLNDVLNLNLPWLKNNRKSVLTSVLDWWRARRPVPKERIAREIGRQVGGDGDLQPYCQVAVWWLNQKLTRMA